MQDRSGMIHKSKSPACLCLRCCWKCHRKGYHLLALGLFLPALLWEPQLLSISLAIAFALLVVLEIVRLGGVPYVGKLTTASHATLLLLPACIFNGGFLPVLQRAAATILLLPGACWHLEMHLMHCAVYRFSATTAFAKQCRWRMVWNQGCRLHFCMVSCVVPGSMMAAA